MSENSSPKQLIAGTMRLGQWGAHFDTPSYLQFIESCLELGVDTFDHADIYGDYTTEAEFGAALKSAPSLKQQIKLITKCGIRRVCRNKPEHKVKSYDSSPDHIIASVNQSLQNLDIKQLDCLLLHRPDHLMEPAAIAETIQSLKSSGKIKRFGVSNFTKDQLRLLSAHVPIEVHQIECHLLQLDPFEKGMLDYCMKQNIEVQAWSPLAGGALFAPNDERSRRVSSCAQSIAKRYDCSIDQLLLAFLNRHPTGIRPVTGTSKLERIKTAIQAQEIELDAASWYELYQASSGNTLP